MNPGALALLLVAAMLHCGWNLLLKRSGERFPFLWLTVVCASILTLPLLIGIPFETIPWRLATASALLEALYFILLASAYGRGEFSLIYPVARGAAPAFLALWSWWFLGEHFSAAGLLGIAGIVLGLMVVGWAPLAGRRGGVAVDPGGIAAALAIALVISLYSAVDGAAVKQVQPRAYLAIVLSASTLIVTPWALQRYGRAHLLRVWRTEWRSIVSAALLMDGAFLLVLLGYAISQVGYAGAVREISIVFGAWLGWRLLGERFGRLRVIGAIVIVVGILLIAVGGR